MTYDSTLTVKGQVTVPASIRRSLGLKAGEVVRFRVNSANQVVIEKNNWKKELESLHAEVAAHFKNQKIKPLSDEQLDIAIDQSAAKAAAKDWQQSQ